MTITAAQLAGIFRTGKNLEAWAPAISDAWRRFRFQTANEQASYLAIIGNESGGLTSVHREGMEYSPARAAGVFGSTRTARCQHLCTLTNERKRVRFDAGEAFANCVYANMIGNGPFETGDGWRFRGGGIIQLTGRGNYRACGRALGLDLEADPDSLTSDPAVSAAAAAWFMADYARILPSLGSDSEADFLEGAGKVGWTDETATARRLNYRRAALAALAGAPADVPHGDTGRPEEPSTGSAGISGSAAASRTLRKGCSGPDVVELQVLLLTAGYSMPRSLNQKGKPDGHYGDETKGIVTDFQTKECLDPVDGIAGPVTMARLRTRVAERGTQ